MHPLPSHLAQQLYRAREAEAAGRLHQPAGLTRRSREPRATRPGRSVRQSTGWFLIQLGLRLAAPRSPMGAVR